MKNPDYYANLSPWIRIPKPNPQARMRLFCFPYAGASASVYYPWCRDLAQDLELCAIQFPGRETRIAEEPISAMEPLVAALLPELMPYLDKPFLFFGHSMGATVCFEIARRLILSGSRIPEMLFVSASRAPHLKQTEDPIYLLPGEAFIKRLRSFSGTPEEIFQYPELLELYLPILRADLSIEETYTCSSVSPFPFPISGFGGEGDKEVDHKDLEAWAQYSAPLFSLRLYPGGHFFIREHQQTLIGDMMNDLAAHILYSGKLS